MTLAPGRGSKTNIGRSVVNPAHAHTRHEAIGRAARGRALHVLENGALGGGTALGRRLLFPTLDGTVNALGRNKECLAKDCVRGDGSHARSNASAVVLELRLELFNRLALADPRSGLEGFTQRMKYVAREERRANHEEIVDPVWPPLA